MDLKSSLIKSLPGEPGFEFLVFSNYEQAKQIFRASLKQYKDSQAIYTLEEFATEHIELVKDLVGLYSHCLFLETGKIIYVLTFRIRQKGGHQQKKG